MRRATFAGLTWNSTARFQSTLSMRRATRLRHSARSSFAISIHALHEESDHASGMPGMAGQSISIHALHEESDRQYRRQRAPDQISIHALHEESDTTQAVPQSDCSAISIHALHEESDQDLLDRTQDMELFQSTLSMRRATDDSKACWQGDGQFQSTLSMRRATRKPRRDGQGQHISIHALHEESDLDPKAFTSPTSDFNPRSP